MKKIITLILIVIAIIIIYYQNMTKSNIKLLFSDNNKYEYTYVYNDTRIPDIIRDIENNITIKDKTIQNLLVTSNIIEIDINNLVHTNNISSILSNLNYLEILVKTIRKYSKEHIKLYLLKEKTDLDKYANEKIIQILNKYDIIMVR